MRLSPHRAQVQYLGSPAERAVWRLANALCPSKVLGHWRTKQSEWLYVHKSTCLCQPCEMAR